MGIQPHPMKAVKTPASRITRMDIKKTQRSRTIVIWRKFHFKPLPGSFLAAIRWGESEWDGKEGEIRSCIDGGMARAIRVGLGSMQGKGSGVSVRELDLDFPGLSPAGQFRCIVHNAARRGRLLFVSEGARGVFSK
jgi:hypothetical protein